MINIVGKVMLADIRRSCQDEYAPPRYEAQGDEISCAFTVVSGKWGRMTGHVNLNATGAGG